MTRVTHDYFTLALPEDPTAAVVYKFTGIDGDWRLDDGQTMGGRFPPTVTAQLDADWGERLTDFLGNTAGLLVLSEAARAVFEDAPLENAAVRTHTRP